MSTAISLMIMAQQRANAARRAMITMDPNLPSAQRVNWRRALSAQVKAAKADALRYAEIALREMERGARTGDLFALVNVQAEGEEDAG